MKKYCLLVILSVALSLNSVAYAKKIKRSCFGSYKVVTRSLPYPKTLDIGTFKAEGKCGAINPKRCRSRAVGHIADCVRSHWNLRNNDHHPIHCTPEYGVFNYPFVRLKNELEGKICERLRIHDKEIIVSIYLHAAGN